LAVSQFPRWIVPLLQPAMKRGFFSAHSIE
jgi:hypothetical protein